MSARWQSQQPPDLAVYLSPDPEHMLSAMAYTGPQAYAYASGRPLVNVDPDGRQVILVGGAGGYAQALSNHNIVSTSQNLLDEKCGKKHCGLDRDNLRKVYEAFAGSRTVVVSVANQTPWRVAVVCGYTVPDTNGNASAISYVPVNPAGPQTVGLNNGRVDMAGQPLAPGTYSCSATHAKTLFHEVIHAATGLREDQLPLGLQGQGPEDIYPCITGDGRCQR